MRKIKIHQIIRTERLTLRTIEDGDKAEMLALLLNAEIGKTFMLPVFAKPEDALPLFERLKALSETPTRFVYGICLQNKLIGFINDVELDEKRAELGYVIHPDYKNQGYATETLAAAMNALFQAGLTVVETGAFKENPASMRVMEKCGMRKLDRVEQIEYRVITHTCVYYQKTAENEEKFGKTTTTQPQKTKNKKNFNFFANLVRKNHFSCVVLV